MSKYEKLLREIMSGKSDTNIRFNELTVLMGLLGFSCRIKGSHHIYYKDGVDEILNFQSDKGKAKAYQVAQLRTIISRYRMELSDNE